MARVTRRKEVRGRRVQAYLLGAPLTLAIVAVNVGVYVAQKVSGQWHAEIDNLWHTLGFHRSNVLHGEVWRVFTPNLIHTIKQGHGPPGLGHLVFNMLTLLAFGPKAEQIFGRLRYLALYFVCGTVAFGWLVLAHPHQG